MVLSAFRLRPVGRHQQNNRMVCMAQGPRPSVYVYNGEGAGTRCAISAAEALKASLQGVEVKWLNPEALLAGEWVKECILLVMPGGADLPYCRRLNGPGNQLIKDFVQAGGSYLGLCAGAYYACSRVEFEVNDPGLEVVGDRELAFWPYTARGAAYSGFDYASEAGAIAAPISFLPSYSVSTDDSTLNHSVGSASCQPPQLQYSHIVPGTNMSQAATPCVQQHPDQQSPTPWMACRDYLNGGPVFIDGSSEAWVADDAAHTQQQSPPGQGNTDAATGACTLARARHGRSFKPLAAMPPGSELLAVYDEVGPAAAAAVRTRVGAGVAVLCGTHPELHPDWLDQSCTLLPADGWCTDVEDEQSGDSEALRAHVVQLAATLRQWQAQRQQFWQMLLAACCVGFKPVCVQ